jgi:hypothetical protein
MCENTHSVPYRGFLQLLQDLIHIEAGRLLARWELLEGCRKFAGILPGPNEQLHAVSHPSDSPLKLLKAFFERVGPSGTTMR